jgi:hypothetical protein
MDATDKLGCRFAWQLLREFRLVEIHRIHSPVSSGDQS